MTIPSSGLAWPELASKVDPIVEALMAEEELPGLTVAMTKNGRLIFSKGYGWANASTEKAMEPFMRSRIGSVTKAVVTGPAARQLLESKGIDPKTKRLYGEGGIFRDRFMNDIRIGIEAHAPGSAPWMDWYMQITLQHLLDHAAGFTRSGDSHGAAAMFTGGDKDALSYEHIHRHFLRTRELLYEPGTSSDYSNHGFGVWTIVIEEVAGEPYRSYVMSKYLRPLGLHMYILPQRATPDSLDATSHELIRFLRHDTDGGGDFSEASIDGSVAAFANADGNLHIIPYFVTDEGGLSRGEVVEAGPASEVKLVHPDPHSTNAVTALRNAGGNLQLIGWSISSGGQVTRKGVAVAGQVKQIAVTPFPDGKGVVTATRGDDESLKLIAWKVTSALDLVRGGDVQAGTVKRLAVTTTRAGFPGVVSATTGNDDRLKLIVWEFDPAATTFTRRGEAEAGSIQGALNIVRARLNARDMVVTGFRNGSGNLMLIAWEVDATGQIERKGQATAGSVGLIDLAAASDGRVIASVRDSDGNLRLIAYKVSENGQIKRDGDAVAGTVDRIASSVVVRNGREFLLTAVRGSDRKLRTIAWELD